MQKLRKAISLITVLAAALWGVLPTAAAGEDLRYSEEYKTSPYYARLQQALEDSWDAPIMERTLAVARSQEGYLNYAAQGVDVEQARADGLLWTGTALRMNDYNTGNTEYTRWAQRYLAESDEAAQYADYDWCAIFVSWCLYQAGYYDDEALKRYFYSYTADPRIFFDADSWLGAFNCDQQRVWYVPKARRKLEAMDWNTYYNVDVDPYDIPYRPGGLVFFSWNTTGEYFDHVAIVADYDPEEHILTYTNGNSDGQVITRELDLDDEGAYDGEDFVPYSECIMAYAEYERYAAPGQREIHAGSTALFWDVSAPAGLKIRTDSQSIRAAVYIDGSYHGSIIESNMVFHEGLLSIGRSELVGLSVGEHRLRLVFDDGELELRLIVTDRENAPCPLLGDVDLDGDVSILDATAIQRCLAGLEQLGAEQRAAADTDGDGDLSVIDATYIQRWLVSLASNDAIGQPVGA